MSITTQPPIFFLKVSTISHVEFCSKRAKIETFNKFNASFDKPSMLEGIRLHYIYSYGYMDFDREFIRYRLDLKKVNGALQKQIGNVVIRGNYDDIRVHRYKDKKYVSILELKTTNKDYMWSREVKASIRQLQLYMWLMKDLIEELGYKLSKKSYLEIRKQKTFELIKRIPVEYDPNIEEWIYNVIEQFNGTAKMSVPPYKYCKLCPSYVRQLCSWYALRRKN